MKAKYGLQAMLFFADRGQAVPVLISELSDTQKIPRKYLEMILLELKNNGFLDSKKGKGGGYWLVRPPEEISLGSIIRVLSGPLAMTPCANEALNDSSTPQRQPCQECPDPQTCAIRLVMIDVCKATCNILDNTTLQSAVTLAREAKLKRGGQLEYAI